MKKLIVILALAMPMLVSAQKLGYVNTNELFTQMPEMAKIKLKMDTIQTQWESQLLQMQEEIQKKAQDYQAQVSTMTEAIRQIREQELSDMQQRLQLNYQMAEQDIQKQQQELLAPVHERMAKAINAVGEKEGYTYIFDSAAMVYIAPTAENVMPSVKKELKIK